MMSRRKANALMKKLYARYKAAERAQQRRVKRGK